MVLGETVGDLATALATYYFPADRLHGREGLFCTLEPWDMGVIICHFLRTGAAHSRGQGVPLLGNWRSAWLNISQSLQQDVGIVAQLL